MGNCYEVHGRIMLDDMFDITLSRELKTEAIASLRLCHGTVIGPTVGKHGHAWLELADAIVLDFSNGHHLVAIKEVYYTVSQAEDVKIYTLKQMLEMVLKYEHWGPWEEAQMVENTLNEKGGKEHGLGPRES